MNLAKVEAKQILLDVAELQSLHKHIQTSDMFLSHSQGKLRTFTANQCYYLRS